jgi:hypothetical protein
MSVYVDEARDYGTLYLRGKKTLWAHLTADTEQELHDFAAQLGLQRRWFQGFPAHSLPHYDVTGPTREQAIRLGAIPEEAGSPEATERHKAMRIAARDPSSGEEK